MLLLATARILLSEYFPLRGQDQKRFWRKIREDLIGSSHLSSKSLKDGWRNARITEGRLISPKIEKFVKQMNKAFVGSLKNHFNPSYGLSLDDYNTLQGLRSRRFTKCLREELIAESRRTRIRSKYSRDITVAEEKVQELISNVLLVASDGQAMTGMVCSRTM